MRLNPSAPYRGPMCLAVPARVLAIEGPIAVLDSRGTIVRADASMVPIHIGDYVLVQSGLVTQILDPAEAQEQLELLREVFSAAEP